MYYFVEPHDKKFTISQETILNNLVTQRSMNRTPHGYSSDKEIDSVDEKLDAPENEATEISEISIEI